MQGDGHKKKSKRCSFNSSLSREKKRKELKSISKFFVRTFRVAKNGKLFRQTRSKACERGSERVEPLGPHYLALKSLSYVVEE